MKTDSNGIPLAHDAQTISFDEANKLLRSGEWQRDREVTSEVARAMSEFERRFSQRAKLAGTASRIEMLFPAIRALLSEHGSFEIRDDFDSARNSHLVQMRIGPGAIVKVGAAVKDLIPKAIAFGFYLVSTAEIGTIFYGSVAVSAFEIMRVLKSSYEKIEDPDERAVFEAIAVATSKMVVTDHEAFEREEFSNAFGKQPPMLDDLVAMLDGKIDRHTVEKSLAAMKLRGVVAESGERWRIRL